MSHISDRCKTDPDEDNEIQRKRKQVQQFIQNSKEEQKKITQLFKKDLDLQSEKIKERIQKRIFNKAIAKSSSCGVYMSSNTNSKNQSLADTEDYQESLYENVLLELDNQRDEKIYRIVKHYNNQINQLREKEYTTEILQQMLLFEKQKWEEIQNIQQQYEVIKSNQIKL
ncbi:unnamed protein product (macronuclear) [Paramecium tetraurelia]|uniref:Uncharacterized protein n=1 Tax=Paramecium tetraurelia TaxID=5888 RepID=A0CGX7_PARTE|nr:uncharacterized protein GSPATT00007484001 [Paramecium tetraurelia]CAK70044.1 unnamed protein product [Paramecium tetraurelia]|eukprot:XP_001437441.1 hypothetical protein (macronuclear) [Paramecium tetraurelia strain d4-2]